MRVFLAINLPNPVRYELEAILHEAEQNNDFPGLRWIKPKSLHLTLHFLGDQDEQSVKRIIEISKLVAKKFHPLNVRMGEWGGFPNLQQPRIVYISLVDTDVLLNLQKDIGVHLKSAGYEIEKRPWQSHITVARNKNFNNQINLKLPGLSKLEWEISSFELMQSQLLPDGAEYETVKSFALGR